MLVCYVDEAGCTGAVKSSTDSVQPLIVLCGLIVEAHAVRRLSEALIDLKIKYFPQQMRAAPFRLDVIRHELKGADLRSDVRSGDRSKRRRATAFLDDLVALLEAERARLVGKVFVKAIGEPIDGASLYTSAMQGICRGVQDCVTGANSQGLVIADCRSKALNTTVAHSVFTQRFQSRGDAFNRFLELPVFGNSENHAGLQICDLLASGLLFPIAAYSYCLGHIQSVHVSSEYRRLKTKFGPRLEALQHRYTDQSGRQRGGFVVSDKLKKRPGSVLFR